MYIRRDIGIGLFSWEDEIDSFGSLSTLYYVTRGKIKRASHQIQRLRSHKVSSHSRDRTNSAVTWRERIRLAWLLEVPYIYGVSKKTNQILNFSRSKSPGSRAKYCETRVQTEEKYFLFEPSTLRRTQFVMWKQTITYFLTHSRPRPFYQNSRLSIFLIFAVFFFWRFFS